MRRSLLTTSTVILCALELVGVMGSTLLLTLLPVLLRVTGSEAALPATALATAYAVGFGGLLVLGARLGDAFGHVRAVVWSGLVFAGAAVAMVVTGSVWVMAGARLLQGAAAAITVPAALALITKTVPAGAARRRAMAAWGATSAAGGAAGFLVGGAAAAAGWWQAAFLAPAALQLVLVIGVWTLLGPLRPPGSSRPPLRLLDLPGGLLITVTIGLVVAGTSLVALHTSAGLVILALAVAGVLAVVRVERRSPRPVLQMATVRKRAVRDGSLVSFVNTATTSSAATLLTLALQTSGTATAAVTALTMLPFSLAVIVGSAFAPRLMGRHGDAGAAAAGLLLIGAGIAALPLAHDRLWMSAVGMALSGAGIGVAAAAATHLGTNTGGQDQAPAAALLNTAAQLGTALGVAVSIVLATVVGTATVWWILVGVAAFASAAARRSSRLSAGV